MQRLITVLQLHEYLEAMRRRLRVTQAIHGFKKFLRGPAKLAEPGIETIVDRFTELNEVMMRILQALGSMHRIAHRRYDLSEARRLLVVQPLFL